jgi:hypothetical protein
MTEERIGELVRQAMAAVKGAVSDPRGQIEMTIRQAVREAGTEYVQGDASEDAARYRWLAPRMSCLFVKREADTLEGPDRIVEIREAKQYAGCTKESVDAAVDAAMRTPISSSR